MRTFKSITPAVATAIAALAAQSALAGSHSWVFNEVFSTADGSIQFFELWESNGLAAEIHLLNLQIFSESTGNVFTFPSDIVGPTTDKYLLIATESFADLPGAPTPDFILEEGFFDPDGDTLTYHVYDQWTFGAVPTDCVDSIHRNFKSDPSTGPNTPTNYLGATGEVDACPSVDGDLDGDGDVDFSDLLTLLAAWGNCRGDCPADLDGSGAVGFADLLVLLANWS